MKLTLALLLFASVAVGQTNATHPIWRTDGEITYVRFLDSVSYRPVTVHDLSEYSKECYADSTLERWHDSKGSNRMCIADWECLIASHYKTGWTHREPTFPGFIQYMKGKK